MKNKTTKKEKKTKNKSPSNSKAVRIKWDKKYLKYFWNVISTLVIALLIVVATGIMLSYVKNPLGISAFSVLTNSMKPEISRGSLIFTKQAEEYVVGDIITYEPTSGRLGGVEVDTVTHRVVEVIETDGKKYYRTKGDANPGADVDPAEQEKVVGRVVAEIPLIGFPIEFSKTERGFFILVVIPALFIIYEEVRSIKEELRKRGQSPEQKNQQSGKRIINQFLATMNKIQQSNSPTKPKQKTGHT